MGRPPLERDSHGGISIVNRGQVWFGETRYKDPYGKVHRIARTRREKTQVHKAIQDRIAVIRAENPHQLLSPDTLMADVAILWREELEKDQDHETGKGVSRNHVFGSIDTNWITPVIGQLRGREMLTSHCDRVVSRVRVQRGVGTARVAKSALRSLVSFAQRNDVIKADIMIGLPRIVEKERRVITALDKEQRTAVAVGLRRICTEKATPKPGMRRGARQQQWAVTPDVQQAMLCTGVRIGEVLALGAPDMDMDRARLEVRWHVIRVPGRGLVRAAGRKGGAPNLTLTVPSWSLPMWERLVTDAQGTLLFPSWRGTLMDPNDVRRVLQEAMTEIGYGWVRPHDWRKTIAEVLDEAGLSVSDIAAQLGNTRAVVERHYLPRRVSNPRSRSALEGME